MGLVTLPLFAAIIWLTVSGWRDFYWVGRGASRKLVHFLWFLPLAAAISAAVYVLSLFCFAGRRWDVYSFAFYLAICNIGGLWILSILGSLLREGRNAFSNACRVGAAFYPVYFAAFPDSLALSLGVEFKAS